MRAEIRKESLDQTFERWKSDTLTERRPNEPEKVFIFEDEGDYWNAVASIFLHYHWEKAFRRFDTFRNKEADPFLTESYDVLLSLSGRLPDRFADEAPPLYSAMLKALKPKMRWPWTYRFVDIMGTVGETPSTSEYVVALGLVQPMEHLAFLLSLSESSLFLRVLEDGTVSIPQDGDFPKGHVSEFRFRLPESEESRKRVENLREALAHNPGKVSLFIPRTYSGWKSMRESFDDRSVWKAGRMEGIVFHYDPESHLEKRNRFESSKGQRALSEEIHWNPMVFDTGHSTPVTSSR